MIYPVNERPREIVDVSLNWYTLPETHTKLELDKDCKVICVEDLTPQGGVLALSLDQAYEAVHKLLNIINEINPEYGGGS